MRRTTKEEVETWLSENLPQLELIEWSGKAATPSIFRHRKTGNELRRSFSAVKNDTKAGLGDRLGIGHKGVPQKRKRPFPPDDEVRSWLSEHMPHIELVHNDRKATFKNTQTGREYKRSFSNVKSAWRRGCKDIGVGKSEGLRRWHLNRELETEAGSSLELTVKSWLDEWDIAYHHDVSLRTEEVTTSLRPDFCLEDHKVIIECDGLYWHCDLQDRMDRRWHKDRKKAFDDLGYRSFFFRADEIRDKPNVCKAIIQNALNINERLFARKCTVDVAYASGKEFLDTHHLMGKGSGQCFALLHEGKTVLVMQVKWRSVDKKSLEISRLCSAPGVSVVGGFSKLLKHVEDELDANEIVTYIDKRYGEGSYLSNLGFEHKGTHVSFKWTDLVNTFHRMKYPGNSGYEHDLCKIWDCGQAKFVKTL